MVTGVKKVAFLIYLRSLQLFSLYGMIALYIMAGINHFWHPEMYISIMPPYLPYHRALVYVSGACEIGFGLLLVPLSTRGIAAWLIISLLIAVFPANIQMTIDYYHRHNPYTWLTIVRLPVQILLVVWAWQFTGRNA
jgi:uncharacterized membrane protein